MSRGYSTATRDGILLDLRVSPGAKHSAIGGRYGESALKLKVAAPPAEGKANAERFLAELLGIARSSVTVVRGASGRDKTVLVRGVREEKVQTVLSAHLR